MQMLQVKVIGLCVAFIHFICREVCSKIILWISSRCVDFFGIFKKQKRFCHWKCECWIKKTIMKMKKKIWITNYWQGYDGNRKMNVLINLTKVSVVSSRFCFTFTLLTEFCVRILMTMMSMRMNSALLMVVVLWYSL